MRRSSPSLCFALLLFAGAVVPALAFATACPPALVEFERFASTGPTPVFDASYDQTFTDTWTARFQFDRSLGTLALTASSVGRATGGLRVIEWLDVTGVAPGTVVPAVLELRLDGHSTNSCGGSGCGVLLAGTLVALGDSTSADANQAGPGGATRPIATTISRPVTFLAGTPMQVEFFLEYGTGPGGSASGTIAGHYAVSGLPAGVHAIVCSGADVTPVRPATWGRLKTLYR